MKQFAAVIVENRNMDNFGHICYDHMKYLSDNSELVVYTAEDLIEEYGKQITDCGISAVIHKYEDEMPLPKIFNRIDGIQSLLDENEGLKPLLQYSLFMTSKEFWQPLLKYERILIFQTDSGLIRKGIDPFLKWDYIGAPCYNYYNGHTIQNGGLSIRNPRIMEYIGRHYGWESDLEDLIRLGSYSTGSFFAEDIFFCLRMIKHSVGNYAPMDEARKFSMESKLEFGTLGYHRIDKYFDQNIVDTIKRQYEY